MGIELSERAAKRILGQLAERGRGVGLRVGVKEAGCSGFAYTLDYADEVGRDDTVFESHGAKVVVARASLPLLDGMQVDFRREGLNEVFRFDNPKAKALCGCGESFAVES